LGEAARAGSPDDTSDIDSRRIETSCAGCCAILIVEAGMKNELRLLAIVLLIVGGGTLYLQKRNVEQLSAHAGDGASDRMERIDHSNTSQSHLDDAAAMHPVPHPQAGKEPAEIQDVYRATSARNLLALAVALPTDSFDIRQQLMRASQYCGYLSSESFVNGLAALRSGESANRVEAKRRDHKQFVTMLRGFCGDVDAGQLAAVAEHAARTSDSDPNKEALAFLGSLADADPEVLADSENQKTLMDIASKTESPEVLQRALDLAAIGGTEPLFMDFDRSLPDGIGLDRRVELRRLAAQYAVCEWTGGCGPGTLRTISSCTYFGRCMPGYSWEETLGGIYTPREVEGVRNLGRALLRKAKP
jgi:hypothetical protein